MSNNLESEALFGTLSNVDENDIAASFDEVNLYSMEAAEQREV